MGAGYKFDHPPLLAPGRHYLSLADVERLCVTPFPKSPTREKLFYALEELLQRLLRERICCELWVDGSFVTEKDDPEDVDVIIKIDHDFSENLTPSQRLLVDEANEAEYIKGVDSFVFVALPRGHPDFGSDIDEGAGWAEHFGVERSEAWCKGFVVLQLGETSVGIRLRR